MTLPCFNVYAYNTLTHTQDLQLHPWY